MKFGLGILALLLLANPGLAATTNGHVALALAGVVGSQSSDLSAATRAELARLFDGNVAKKPVPRKFTVTAASAVCRAGDVDITAFSCDLTFGKKSVSLHGRAAHEVFATMAEAGVPVEGAAGTLYEALHNLSCTIDPSAIGSGGGAECSFDPGMT